MFFSLQIERRVHSPTLPHKTPGPGEVETGRSLEPLAVSLNE